MGFFGDSGFLGLDATLFGVELRWAASPPVPRGLLSAGLGRYLDVASVGFLVFGRSQVALELHQDLLRG